MISSLSQTKIKQLRQTAIFSSLDDDELHIIAEYCEYRAFRKNDVIFKSGNHSQALYIVESGEVIINKKNHNGREIDIARFLTGDCFGELDMLTGSARTASARAEDKTRLLRFPGKKIDFKEILKKHPALAAKILHTSLVEIAGRIRKANSLIKENSPIIQELKKQVYRDKLTGLFNKIYLEEKLVEFLAGNSSHVCLLMFKPDNFKHINDSYGHEAGDQVLKIIAMLLKRILPQKAVAIRFLGNELAVILPDTEQKEARLMAEKIQLSLSRLDLRQITQGNSFSLTVSIGIAIFPKHADNAGELILQVQPLPLLGRSQGGNKILFPEDKVKNLK